MAEENKAVEGEVKSSSSGMDPKLAAMLAWIFTPVTSVIFLLIDDLKKDEFVQFHSKQSLYWFFVEIIGWFVIGLLSVVTFGIFACVGAIWPFVYLGVRVYGGYKAYQGEKFKLPVIGDMAEK